jgi:hypothetical protein
MNVQEADWEMMCEKYWLWFYPEPRTDHPCLDDTGDRVSRSQDTRNLFFLAGPVDRKEYERTLRIQAKGKKIFMPIIFCTFAATELPRGADLIGAANKDIDGTRFIKVDKSDSIIVEDIRRVRVSKLFKVKVADPPFFEVAYKGEGAKKIEPGEQEASSDGYWLLTKPLDAGHHTISANGQTKEDDDWKAGVKYNLEVV